MDIQFRLAEKSDKDFLFKHIRAQQLNYPNYLKWVDKAMTEFEDGYKQAILAFYEKVIVGNLLFQQHKENVNLLELKNMRIHPKVQRRYFGQFMIRQVEAENRGGFSGIICDIHSNRKDLFWMLLACGYKPLCDAPLYEPNILETIMFKSLEK